MYAKIKTNRHIFGNMNELVLKAKLAEQSERYDDMVAFMAELATTTRKGLSPEERQLLSVAYKNVVGSRRTAWRTLSTLHRQSKGRNEDDSQRIVEYIEKIENELETLCQKVLDIISDHLLPNATDDTEAQVFFLKMAGDYHRYITEFKLGEERTVSGNAAEEKYKSATEIAYDLASTHPIRLGLALNYSVMMHEIQNKKRKRVWRPKQRLTMPLQS